MDWSKVGKQLLGLGLPTLGTLIGGPLGGTVGKVVADALGVDPTPEAVGTAIENPSPEVLSQLRQAEAEAEKEWAKTAATQSREINKTIRAEMGTVSWYHWRHLLGYVVGGWVAGVASAFVKHMWTADGAAIGNVVTLLNSGFGYFGAACGLLGYVAMDTSRRTAAAATGEPVGTVLGTIIEAVKKKK